MSGTQPDPCLMGAEGSLPASKWTRHEAEQSPLSSADKKNEWS